MVTTNEIKPFTPDKGICHGNQGCSANFSNKQIEHTQLLKAAAGGSKRQKRGGATTGTTQVKLQPLPSTPTASNNNANHYKNMQIRQTYGASAASNDSNVNTSFLKKTGGKKQSRKGRKHGKSRKSRKSRRK